MLTANSMHRQKNTQNEKPPVSPSYVEPGPTTGVEMRSYPDLYPKSKIETKNHFKNTKSRRKIEILPYGGYSSPVERKPRLFLSLSTPQRSDTPLGLAPCVNSFPPAHRDREVYPLTISSGGGCSRYRSGNILSKPNEKQILKAANQNARDGQEVPRKYNNHENQQQTEYPRQKKQTDPKQKLMGNHRMPTSHQP